MLSGINGCNNVLAFFFSLEFARDGILFRSVRVSRKLKLFDITTLVLALSIKQFYTRSANINEQKYGCNRKIDRAAITVSCVSFGTMER